jgi:uncharacterized protein (TIGR03086 family)
MEPVEHWKTVLGAFSDRVEQLTDQQWELPTPCADWSTRQLVEHVAEFQCETVGQLLDGPVDLDLTFGTEPRRTWSSLAATLTDAVDADGALDRQMESPWVAGPYRETLLLPTIDLLFHTWDLARAAGLDETLPESTCEIALETMLPFDDAIRSANGYEGGYADKVEPPPGADVQTRLMCFGGRAP